MHQVTEIHEQRLLAIDYGTKVVGSANFLVEEDIFVQMGERLIPAKGNLNDQLIRLIKDYSPTTLISGLPLGPGGGETKMALKIKKEVLALTEFFPNLSIEFEDERNSSQEAKERMESSPQFNFQYDPKKIDSLSALVILERYLERKKIKFSLKEYG